NDPQRAADLAGEIVDDAYTVGLVGPAGSGEAFAVGDQFSSAGLVTVTPSATAPQLSARGWRTFFRGVASNAVQGPAAANYMSRTLGYRKVCVVDDSSDYGLGLASFVRETLGPMADPACNIAISEGDDDFAAVVPQITGAAPDAVFFAGAAPEAAPLIRQLRDAGFQGAFVTVDGALADEFVEEAQAAASGAVLSCPCAPAPSQFADDYRDTFGQSPGPYAVEAYDLGTILLNGIDSGAITRPALLEYVDNYDGQGIARRYAWNADGELAKPSIWIYGVQ
ncbi:MAG: branched-chain amino acid ABC transporter substrate-binding protein, partial [Actinomycetota bacterium]|nr:branched-chain amino acid ABC transporter substrate-binding protein [Actinomycetota bacterium]